MTTIILADDHPIVREGLRALLEEEAGLEVIAEASEGPEAVDMVERLKPDVLIVDVTMPGLNGLEVTRVVRKRSPQTKVIVLSMHSNEPYVLEALRNGASAYVLKINASAMLVEAIRAVAAGQRYLSPVLAERAIDVYARMAGSDEISRDRYESLTVREKEVLHLAAEGMSNSDIAERLSISPRTAETHRTNLMKKLGLHGQADIVRYAIQRGIVAYS